jgi:hypothetical protein
MFGWKSFIKEHQAEATLCDALIIFNLMLMAAWHAWEGGWSWGPRYLVPFIPLWFLHIAFISKRWQSGKRLWVVASVVLVATMAQIPSVLVSDQETHVVKDLLLTSQERNLAPSDYVSSWILLRHKLLSQNEVYRTSEFHVPQDRELNLTEYPMLIGWNLWTEQLARQLKEPALRWLPAFTLLVIGYFVIRVEKSLKADRQRQPLEFESLPVSSGHWDGVDYGFKAVRMLLGSAARIRPPDPIYFRTERK